MPKIRAQDGDLKPEQRLPIACFGSIFLPICLFWCKSGHLRAYLFSFVDSRCAMCVFLLLQLDGRPTQAFIGYVNFWRSRTLPIYRLTMPPQIVPIIGSSFFSVGTFLMFQSVLNYLTDACAPRVSHKPLPLMLELI